VSLDDGKYTVFSSVSVEASRATLIAQDVTATSVLSTAALKASTVSSVGSVLAGALWSSTVSGIFYGQAGTAQLPTHTFSSEASLGFYRSAASNLAASYGTLTLSGVAATVYASSATTAQSGATAKLGQGQLYFSVLSLTTNGGEFGFRSGNTVYRFASVDVG